MSVNVRSLIAKLNVVARGSLEGAAGVCFARTHHDVELEHFLVKAFDVAESDLAHIARHFDVDRARLATDLAAGLDRLRTGNARTPSFSRTLVRALTQAWTIASLDFEAPRVRTGHVLLALLDDEELERVLSGVSVEFEKVSRDALRRDFVSITARSAEAEAKDGAAHVGSAATGARTPGLDQFTVDLTARAREGKIDPVMGREREVRQAIDVLTRRRQNNPILVGEAGVGKTAIVEGLARRIADGDVPAPLRNVTLRTLDLALLQAGAGVKGEFEDRLKKLIDEVKNSPAPIILFIDEAHTMIGAGGAAGQNDAANLLKPALARGELRTIAATTWAEYKKYFEKDPALSRRFQLVKVEEPSEEACLVMLRAVVPALEAHHNVRVTDEGLDAAVRLSHRYLPDRQLPDKAVSVLDTACARLSLGQQATPASIEDARRRLDDLAAQARVLGREAALGVNHRERLDAIARDRAALELTLATLTTRWERERELVERIRAVRDAIERTHADVGTTDSGADALDARRDELTALQDTLASVQGEAPLVRVNVDASAVSDVISGWTGVPVGKMLRDQVASMLDLERLLGERVIGQDDALAAISRRIRTSAAKIEDPGKPKGVFLLVGPSGVGKTETALALGDLLYGGEQNVVTVNMTEFQEAHTVATLKGSPPGYVGYGEGGVLTEAVRRRPHSVVLLDEIEKAHPDVLELFFQVFDKGVLEDSEGRQIDFKNTVIILTSNVGTDAIMAVAAQRRAPVVMEDVTRAIRRELHETFKPAFLGRTVVVPYLPVRDEALRRIVRLKLDRVDRRLFDTHRLSLVYDATLVDAVVARCTEVESGARNVDNILSNTLLPSISNLLLGALADGRPLTAVHVEVATDGNLVCHAGPVSPALGGEVGAPPAMVGV